MTTFWLHHERTRRLRPAFLPALACALALHSTAAVRYAAAEGSSIGLYTDASGGTCSFSGGSPGLITAYVVVRPDAYGVSAVQFAAPIPACLGATFVSEVLPPGMLSIGSSQDGISIALQSCSLAPVNVLQITYLRSSGTTPCCEFPIVADPSDGSLAATDCWYQEVPLTGVTSHFNADASCSCIGNSPPFNPTNPLPYDGEMAVSVYASFAWDSFDRDGNLAEYDLYLGTDPSPPLFAAGLADPSYTPAAPLAPFAQHYWRVVARDALGLESSSVTWTFTTRGVNTPPYPPQSMTPPDGARDVSLTATLRWSGADIDDDPLRFDVYFGTSTSPPLALSDTTDPRYAPGAMIFGTTYYWRVVVRDPLGQETSGPVLSFETRPANYPPRVPTVLAPPNNSLGQLLTATLSWTATDVDPDTLVSDVYFGTSATPPLVASNLAATTYAPPGLAFSTQYFWRIVVRDHYGVETSGVTWTFTTRPENYPPNVPSNPVPANGGANQSESVTLTWQSGDVDGDAVTYDVYFGTSPTPPLVASDVTTKSYVPGLLAFQTTYRWKVVARDALGAETEGPLWAFITRINSPPNIPSSPSPANNAVGRPVNQTLAWQCTDPNGHAVVFDVYFGTSTPPPLVASNVATTSYNPGLLALTTTYRWQIMARDAFGLERAGPTWSFTTRANSAPAAPSSPNPSNHGLSVPTPMLTWSATDVDGQPLTFDVYFGNASPPPLVASGLTVRQYEPGTLSFGVYYWRVVSSDGFLSTSSPTWDFRVAQMGDADADGAVTLGDASCVLNSAIGLGTCLALLNPAADVNCSGAVSPRDARCIHRFVLDGSCAFCDGAAVAAPAGVNTPSVSMSATWEADDTLYVRLAVSGVPSLESFLFFVDSNADYVRAVRRGATSGFAELRFNSAPGFAIVAGYSLSGAPASVLVDFIELRFYAAYWYDRFAYISYFADDLEGASPLSLFLGGGGVPVLITSFEAVSVDNGVDVRWDLKSDEALEGYTLYRRDDAASTPVVASQGPATSRSYVDTSVEDGKTYHYELVIRTTDGHEFRSQIATVSTRVVTLALGQNHPNPFNPQTTIPYDLPAGGSVRVRLWILDISGRLVSTLVDEDQSGGSYKVTWEGKDDRGDAVSSGVYFYVLDAGAERRTRKLVLLK